MKDFVNNFNQGVDFDHLYQRDVATQYCVLFALKEGCFAIDDLVGSKKA